MPIHTPDVVVVGSYIQDQAMRMANLPAPGVTQIGYDLKLGCGGKGFNQAVASQRQGVPSLFIGAVGNDSLAQDMRAFASQEDLQVALETIEGLSTGIAQIQVAESTGQNQIAVYLGANDRLSRQHIEVQESKIESSGILVVQLEANLDAVRRSLEIARSNGVITVLNPAPINDGLTPEILQLVDVLIPNESEFAFLASKQFGLTLEGEYWNENEGELLELCRGCNVPSIILTLGEAGSLVVHNQNASALDARAGKGRTSYTINDERSSYRVQRCEVDAVDTTGAGDAFCGGFAAAMIRHSGDFAQAVIRANVVAGLAVTQHGTAPAMPTKDAVDRFLAA